MKSQKVTRRAFLGTAAATAAASITGMFGCKTADYNRRDINLMSHMPNSGIEPISYNGPTLGYRQTREILGEYKDLPKLDVILNFPEESVDLDTTGPLDGKVGYGVSRLEGSLAGANGCSIKTGFYFGEPDAEKPRARENQASTRSRILGVESIANQGNYFFIDIREKTKINKRLFEESEYQAAITFGEPAFRLIKTRRDPVYLLTVAEDAGIGFAVTGNWIGAAIGGGIGAVQGVECYLKGLRPPRQSLLVDNTRVITGLPPVLAQTYQTLRTAEKLHASDVALLNWKRTGFQSQKDNSCSQSSCPQVCPVSLEGIGIAYVENPKNIRFGDINGDGCLDTVCFDTNREGVNHLLHLINRGLWGFLRFGINETVRYREVECNAGGGRKGEGSSGDGYHGGDRPGENPGGDHYGGDRGVGAY